MLPELKIGNLVAKYPIIQGGMGVGISLSSLAGAVAKSGGIGVISAAQPGWRDPEFARDPLSANLRALAFHIRRAKEISNGGIIGVNIMCALTHYEEYPTIVTVTQSPLAAVLWLAAPVTLARSCRLILKV